MECEGLCNMGSYLIYSTSISHFADFCIKNLKESQDSIYGDGFRYVLDKYQQCGWNKLMLNLKTI